MATKIQSRRGTAAQWTAVNPILAQGEIGYETDTGKFKVGDGSTAWNSMSLYFRDSSHAAGLVSAEATTRAAADTAEATARIAGDAAEAAARLAADTAEATARANADTAEATARAAADTTLTNLVNTKVSSTDTTIVSINRSEYLEAYGSLSAAVAAIGATPTELVVTTNTTVASNTTVPATITLNFQGDGQFSINSGVTVTIGKMSDPGNKQVIVLEDNTANIRFGVNAVQRMNLAWLVGTTGGIDVTDELNQLFASVTANGFGRIYIPEGTWLTTGDHELPSRTILEGAGTYQTLSGPTTLKMTDTNSPILKIGANTIQVLVRDMVLDGDNLANVDGFYGTGAEPANQASSITLERVTITQCVHGVRFFSSAGAWLLRSVKLVECLILDNSFAGFRINTLNNATTIELTNFGVPADAYALYIEGIGNTNIKNCEFAGLPLYIGTRQVLTNTVVAAAGITGDGNAKCVITGTAVSGSPRTITVPVTTALTTATLIAAAFRTALAADEEVNRLFKVGGSGADITLTYLVPDANDGTANFTIEDDTSTGIADDVTSSITTSGVSRDGMAEAVCYYGGSHGIVTFQSCQDEAFKYFIINDASDINALTDIQGSLVQSEILLNQSCIINSFGNTYLSRTYKEGTGNSSRISSVSDYVRPTDAYGNTFSPAQLCGPLDGVIMVLESPMQVDADLVMRRPTQVRANAVDVGDPTTPMLSVGNYTDGTDEDKVLIRLGRTDVYEEFLYYYDILRDYGNGRLKFNGNQTGFKGYDFDSDLTFTQMAMTSTQGLSGTTGAITMDCSASNRFTLTPTGDCTINASGIVAGKKYYLTVLTSGTTSRTLTFGTGFKTTGTLATGTADAKYFVIEFYSPDTTNIIELTRTAAL
jgi:hypothetical protein